MVTVQQSFSAVTNTVTMVKERLPAVILSAITLKTSLNADLVNIFNSIQNGGGSLSSLFSLFKYLSLKFQVSITYFYFWNNIFLLNVTILEHIF